jgi:hypothetical protein
MLEYLHAFKSAAYLGTAAEPRRLLWTLSHAHGALIGLINIAFGLCIRVAPEWTGARPIIPSSCLIASGVLLPLGFFLGGLQPYGGDPGIAGFAIPAGAFLLIVALLLIACKRSMRG